MQGGGRNIGCSAADIIIGSLRLIGGRKGGNVRKTDTTKRGNMGGVKWVMMM